MAEETFLGFPRPDGSVGTRNYVLILPAGFLATKIHETVVGTKMTLTADTGGGRTKRDRETIF